MRTLFRPINFFLCLVAGWLAAGCESGGLSRDKEYTGLRVFVELPTPGKENAQLAHVVGVPIYIEPQPILTEADVVSSRLLDYADGTYAVQVTFSDHGMIQLEMTSAARRPSKLVIYTLFPPKGSPGDKNIDIFASADPVPGKPRIASWSAAPIRAEIGNGVIVFTPDATHQEAERIVRGLNNIGEKNKRDDE